MGATILKVADSVAGECDVADSVEESCKKAPRLTVAGASLVSAFDEKVQVDLSYLGNLFTPRAIVLLSRYSTFLSASSGNPLEVPGASAWS